MTTRFAKIKKFAGLTIMAAATAADAPEHDDLYSRPDPPPTHRYRLRPRPGHVWRSARGTRLDNGIDRFFGAK